MTKLGSGNYLKTADVRAGDRITFKNEGEWIENTMYKYPDGTPRRDFTIKVEWRGAEKLMRLNKTNREAMIEAYGDETAEWLGKSATISIEKVMVGGKKMDTIVLSAPFQGSGKEDETPF